MTKHVIGLTGGIGSGKSAATEAFKSLGISIVDADEVARDVVAGYFISINDTNAQ